MKKALDFVPSLKWGRMESKEYFYFFLVSPYASLITQQMKLLYGHTPTDDDFIEYMNRNSWVVNATSIERELKIDAFNKRKSATQVWRTLKEAIAGWSVEVYKIAIYHDLPVKLAYQQEIIEKMIHEGVLTFYKSQTAVTYTSLAFGGHPPGDGNRQERRKKK